MSNAREKAESIVGPSTVRDIEEAGLRVVGRCAECRHWTRQPEWRSVLGAVEPEHHTCEAPKFPLPFYHDAEDDRPRPGADFGCVLWKQKKASHV